MSLLYKLIKNYFMNEENVKKLQGRSSFLLGFFSGMAIISMIGFITLLSLLFSNKEAVNLAVNADTGMKNQQELPEQEIIFDDVRPIDDTDYVKGDRKAKVQVIVYTDFECPFCARHFDGMQNIIAKYGNKIAYTVRHFPLGFHAEAQKASEAVECAGEQGKFFEMYEQVFEANKAGNMSIETWKSSASQLKLNTTKFNDCLDSGKYAEKVQNAMGEGATFGVEGTPATFINGVLYSGALPETEFITVIDQALK